MKKQHPLLKWFGRTPERCTIYPMPKKAGDKQNTHKTGITLENGEVHIFEFGFAVPCLYGIPWEDLNNILPHHCITCEWNFLFGCGTSYCKHEKEMTSEDCPDWEISPDAIRLASVEYYKALHEKHYGQCGVVVSPSAQ